MHAVARLFDAGGTTAFLQHCDYMGVMAQTPLVRFSVDLGEI